ncbi:hypothetical protein FRB94_010314 [Tulasnella sp. JGI-2019a]|nr:hypothetical protein FRB94_010314 [Tulasnella sp. JGI-2019a]
MRVSLCFIPIVAMGWLTTITAAPNNQNCDSETSACPPLPEREYGGPGGGYPYPGHCRDDYNYGNRHYYCYRYRDYHCPRWYWKCIPRYGYPGHNDGGYGSGGGGASSDSTGNGGGSASGGSGGK